MFELLDDDYEKNVFSVCIGAKFIFSNFHS